MRLAYLLLSRNLLTQNSLSNIICPEHAHKIQCIVYNEHRKVIEQNLQEAAVDDSYWFLAAFAVENLWS
jgi:hypothetical protein